MRSTDSILVIGATGHIGSAAVTTLCRAGHTVIALTRDATRAKHLQRRGAAIAEADVDDTALLRQNLSQVTKVLVIVPPGDPTGDSDADERRHIASILAALDGLPLAQVVAVSTYGARPLEHAADLGTLFDLEQGLQQLDVPVVVQRGAYYLTNWQMNVDAVVSDGALQTMFPADFVVPMVDPADLGVHAAQVLSSTTPLVGTIHVEGPARHTPADVAAAFAKALERDVEVETAPRDTWASTFAQLGFSTTSAASFARMTAETIDDVALPADPIRTTTTLQRFVDRLVRARR